MKTSICLLLFFASIIYSQDATVSIRLDSTTGEHAYITDFWPTLNLTPDPDFAGVAWTMNGIPYIGRSLIKFYFNNIDSNVTVSNASLSLYGNPNPLHSPGHQSLSGTNSCYLRKIITDWSQYSVTWNNQPNIAILNQVLLPPSNSQYENYLNVNVTGLVREMINHPTANHGFMIQLVNEQIYRSLNFASSHCADTSKRPLLTITYSSIGITPISNELPEKYNLFQNYPNPFNPTTKIRFDLPALKLREAGIPLSRGVDGGAGRGVFVRLIIYDILGREVATLVNEQLKPGTYEVEFDGSQYSSGIYFYKLVAGEYMQTKRMVLIK